MGHSPPHDSIGSFPANPMALWVSEPHEPGGGAWGGAWGGPAASLHGQERDTNERLTNAKLQPNCVGSKHSPATYQPSNLAKLCFWSLVSSPENWGEPVVSNTWCGECEAYLS